MARLENWGSYIERSCSFYVVLKLFPQLDCSAVDVVTVLRLWLGFAAKSSRKEAWGALGWA